MTSLDDAVTSQSSSKHIISYIFGSIYHRDFKLSLYDIMSQGPTFVTLTLTFDLDRISQGQGQYFRKKLNLASNISNQRPWPIDSRNIIFFPYGVIGRHSDVTKFVKTHNWLYLRFYLSYRL